LQNCPTYNKATPHEWYQQRVYDVSDTAEGRSLDEARQIAEDLDNKIAIGVLYQDKARQPLLQRLANRQNISTQLVDEVVPGDIAPLLPSFL
jgi:pyruvate/2-oxoacid:ferredoxin oxidoreductase beta subunit